MCGCANRLKIFMRSNGFTEENNRWTHPNGYEFAESEVSSQHTKIMLQLVKEKTLGRLIHG